MRFAALVESVDHVCCRYRLRPFAPAFQASGHSLELIPLESTLLRRRTLYRSLRGYDGVILQRKLLSLPDLWLLRRATRRLLYDFDDALWLRDSYSSRGFDSRKRLTRFRRIVRACDLVVAGNRILADKALELGARQTATIPTCIDLQKYPATSPPPANQPLTLVWVGSSSTLRGLEQNRDLFEAIGQALPGIRLRVVCDRFPSFQNLGIEAVRWTDAGEVAAMATADVGIGYVPDDPWSRGKCALKILQYQAAGLPVVANPVGVQADLVRTGETGYVARTPEEWIAALRLLATDASLRQRLGRAGRAGVEAGYSVQVGERLWRDVLTRIEAMNSPVPA